LYQKEVKASKKQAQKRTKICTNALETVTDAIVVKPNYKSIGEMTNVCGTTLLTSKSG